MKASTKIAITGIITVTIGFSAIGFLLAQTNHIDPWQPVSENMRDSLKKYTDIEQLYERFDNDNPRHNYYSLIATYYWHRVNAIDSAEAFKKVERAYKIKLR